ncbi:acyltransferase family protein [Rhizohabitans arisaemae]|uniref:acyltransferase family protein n=1 Tax=Rhizohabitans arisaemae TaxID=2720610 RepID=UPI0024B14C23|nr:acyltransferase [Rhizohabitans arisaemae]
MGRTFREIRRLAEQTPPSRERFIDLLRAVSIVAVVLGHWLVTVIGYDENGELIGRSALPDLPWAQPLTWLVQVMPVFFFVGGYANAVSLAAERRRGGKATEWLIARSGRLVPPTTALVLVMGGGALVARLFDADPARVRMIVWLASIPLWFLVVYLIVVALTPPMYALHRRYGLAVPPVLVGLVAAGDVARLLGHDFWGNGNFLFGWLAIHQMGFVWRDGLLPARPRVAVPLLLAGIGVLLLLTLVGPYPISMINVPGERLHNMSPPSLALLAVATAQLGVALLLRDRTERWLRRTSRWKAVVAVNSVIMTIFLWHISAVILLVAALHVAGLLPTPEAGSAAWLAWRIPLLVMLSAVLALLIAIFGPVEVRGAERSRRRSLPTPAGLARMVSCQAVRLPLTIAGFAGVAFALLSNSLWPSTAPTASGMPWAALITYLACAAVLRLLRSTPPAAETERSTPHPPPRLV